MSNPYPCTVHKSEHLAEVSFSRDIYCHLFFYLALSAAISKSGNNIIIEESSKTFFFFSLICTDGLPCYRRIGVSVWSACLLLLRKRDPLDVVVFFSLCVCSKGHLLQVTTTNSPKKALHLHIPIVSCSTAPF